MSLFTYERRVLLPSPTIHQSVAEQTMETLSTTLSRALDHQLSLTRQRDELNRELAELSPIIEALREAEQSISLAADLDPDLQTVREIARTLG